MTEKLTILVVGSGGREHALVWALARSPQTGRILAAPGNAGTAGLATNVAVAAEDIDGLAALVEREDVDLTVVGPEVPLSLGLVDRLQAAGRTVFGPTAAAARLESSKAFAKAFMVEQGIPTAAYGVFRDVAAAEAYIQAQTGGLVVKASGLAAGKGVIVCDTPGEALAALRQVMVTRQFGAAGDAVVIEACLSGPEVSLLAFSDGRTVVPMLPARDHKRAFDGDAGPNTGGMGAYAPVPDVSAALVDEIMRTVIIPAVEGLAARGTPYVGVLYAGLMLTAAGPQVLEFNCRFGDPETQVILPLLAGDLVKIMLACCEGRLTADLVQRRPQSCVTVVMAAPGYPGSYPKGLPITGLAAADGEPGVIVFHAGTAKQDGVVVSSGGRVLAVSALGADLDAAAAHAYAGVAAIEFAGAHFRRDIGRRQGEP